MADKSEILLKQSNDLLDKATQVLYFATEEDIEGQRKNRQSEKNIR